MDGTICTNLRFATGITVTQVGAQSRSKRFQMLRILHELDTGLRQYDEGGYAAAACYAARAAPVT
jgi:hypothetical protein